MGTHRRRIPTALLFIPIVLAAGSGLAAPAAADVIFLQDGRTLQVDSVEVRGDRVRVQRPGETIDLPRSQVLSIHTPRSAPPPPGPPAAYPNFVQQMSDRVRAEINAGVSSGRQIR
jgi:hypothetical protein